MIDPWDKREVHESEQPEESGIRLTLEADTDMTAQKAARISQLSKDLGLPENFVIENPYKAEMEATARRMEGNQGLTDWALLGRVNGALAKDDPKLGEAMSIAEKIGNVWGRETSAIREAWEKGNAQQDSFKTGEQILDALARGDNEEAERLQKIVDDLEDRLNPYRQQDEFGILKPGELSFTAKPLQPKQEKEYPPDKPLQKDIDAMFSDINTPPLQQELDSLFSSPPHIYEVDGKAVLLPSLDENGEPISLEQAVTLFQQTGQHAGIFASSWQAAYFLEQTPERQQEIVSNWREKPEDSWVASVFGPEAGIEQLPRMLFDQWPESIKWSALTSMAFAAGATLLGQLGPQAVLPEEVITVPASAAIGGRAGWIAGAGISAFNAERGAFTTELMREKDANGQRLSNEAIIAAANTYGLLSAGVEMLSEAFFLSLLKPLGFAGEGGKAGIRAFIRSAVKRAAFDKNAGAALLDAGLRLGANATVEGIEEGAQQAIQVIVEFLAKGYSNQFRGGSFENNLFSGENWNEIKESVTAGTAAGLWLGAGPIITSTVIDVQSGQMAKAYSENLMKLYDAVEATSTKQLSPAHMESALEFAGPAMRESVGLPADAMLELYQSGTDLITPLGITEDQVKKAAAQGQDFLVPVARLHAYLDRPQFEAATQILRRTPDAMNATEAARIDEKVAADAVKVIELFQSQASELDALAKQKKELRTEFISAIQNEPGLKAQAEGLGGVDKYVNDWLNTVERFALRMASAGRNPVEIFKRIANTKLRLGITEEDITEYEELMAWQEEQEKELAKDWKTSPENLVSFFRGRIDGASLKTIWPEAYREITNNYGPGFFKSKKNGGMPTDTLILEAQEQGLLPNDATDDDIVEMLRKPKGLRRTLYQAVLQSISSADTSLRQVAAAMKKIIWQIGTTNVDIGGGRFDEGTNYLAERGVENLVFDPFNRDEQHNRYVVERLKAERMDTATITNVLNVIAEQEVRAEVIRQAAKAIKQDGVAYFQIYEGNSSGLGKATSKGWQNNARTEFYFDEVRQYFGEAIRKGNLIEARKPQPGEAPAMWMLEGMEGSVEYFQPAPPVESAAFKNWFGDSKVVDKSGNPLVVYHGSPDARFLKSDDAQFMGINRRYGGKADSDEAFWFASSIETASTYADDRRAFDYQNAEAGVESFYLRLENPLVVDAQGKEWREAQAIGKTSDVIEKAKEAGHDGVIIKNVRDDYNNTSRTKKTDTFCVFTPEQIKSVNNRGTFNPNDPNIYFQSAFHGSPYRFSRFNLENIGTGEGAQAYGWGLYFAGDRAIAEWYRQALGVEIRIDGKIFYNGVDGKKNFSTGSAISDDALLALNGDIDAAIKEAREDAEYGIPDAYKAVAILEDMKKNDRVESVNSGHVYETDIPEDDVLLDWDKPFSEQPKKVQAVLEKMVKDDILDADFIKSDRTGMAIYNILAFKPYGKSRDGKNQEKASKELNEYGIKGIRYLDGSSRSQGEGSYNYVIFDDTAIETVQTFYQSMAAPDTVGGITPEIAAKIGIRPGALRLTESDLAAIEQKHSKQFKQAGFANGREFINYVLSHVDAVYKGRNDTYSFVTRGEVRNSRVFAELEIIKDQGTYRITTAQPIRKDFYDKSVPLWERAQTNHSDERTLSAISGQSEEQLNLTIIIQEVNQPARGSTKIYPQGYLVSLFKGADLSTLIHETGHIFYEEMGRAIQSGAADEAMTQDYEKLSEWLSRFDDDETLKAEYDKNLKDLYGGVDFNELEPWDLDSVRSRAKNEYFARGFEAYLMEGKAPAEDLQGAFARFRRWLLKIYSEAINLNVELTDDVRGVFDRMLATEREIATAAAHNELLDLTVSELDALGIIGTARNTILGYMPKARESAAESLRNARDQNRKERLVRYYDEATEEVSVQPVYIAINDMRKTPLDLQAVRDEYGDEVADALIKKVPGGLKDDGGVDPVIFAAEHGFESAADMIAQIQDAPLLKRAIRQRVQEKEARHDAEFEAIGYLLETKEVGVQMDILGRKMAELLGVQPIELEAYVRAAQQELSVMPMGRAMQTGNFLAVMRREMQKSRAAIAAGDMKAALIAHQKAMLNMEFVRGSRDIAKRQGVIERRIKRFVGMAKGDPDARYIVMNMGMSHGLMKFNAQLAEGRDAGTISAWQKAAEDEGYTLFLDDKALSGQQPWREMSVTEFENLTETINQIVTVERNRRQITTAKGKQDLNNIAVAISGEIYAHRDAKPLKTVEKQPTAIKALKNLHAIHTKIEALCIALDGGKPGVVWEHIYRPITEAYNRQTKRFRSVRDALRSSDLFGRYTRKELATIGGKKELVSEIGENLTRENRIAIALNMGNETNISRIRDGHGWNDEQIGAVLRALTKRDWEFVQAVWDYIATFKDEAFVLQEEITGLRPESVEARPFTVQTADGHTMQMRGGYYPIKYDSDKGFTAFQREQKELDKQLFGGRNYGAAMTKNGHLKERQGGGMRSPLLLELSVVTDHLFNVVHDLEYRRAVLDAAKVIRHKDVREAIESTVGREMYRELLPWLQDVANERQEPMHQIHRWARWARSSASIMQMGFKITTMLTQPLGFLQSIEVLGYADAAAGLKYVYANPLRLPELIEETFARSSFMENRIRNFDREVRDFTKQLKPGMGRFAWVDAVKDNAFIPMGMFQMSVDLPTWWGAYTKGLRENGGNEDMAAAYADSVVRISQGSGATQDLARVQRGGELQRMFTMFYSYFNTFYNLGARRISALKQSRSPKDIFMAANTALLIWFVPSVLSELVAGRGPDGEEPEEWLLMNVLQYPFQSVVGVRDLTNAIFGEYGYQITPAQSAPKSLVNWFKSVNKAIENEDIGETIKPTAEAVGYIFGLPMRQPIITVGNLWDYLTGNDPEFEVRDLFFVKPKDRR